MLMYCAQHVDSGGGVMAASKPLDRDGAEKYAARRGDGWRVIAKEWPSGATYGR